MSLEVIKLGKEKCYTEVDYRDLEELVEGFYIDFFPEWDALHYEAGNLVSDNQWNNDSKEKLWLEGDNKAVEAFLNDPETWEKRYNYYKSKRPSYNAFLEDLYALGVIEQDELLVDISW